MKKMIRLIPLLFLLFLATDTIAAGFDDYKKEFSDERFYDDVNTDFDAYQAELNKEFELYKKVVDDEFNKYRTEIHQHWDDVVISDNKKWVEYSKSFDKRKSVNFETGAIEIDIVVANDSNNQKLTHIAVKEMERLIVKTKKQAWDSDMLSQRIESRVKNSTKYYKADTVGDEPILESLLFDKTPSQEKLNEKVISLLQDGQLTVTKKSTKTSILSVKVSLPDKKSLKRANKVKPFVDKYSVKHKLPSALIFAIIHNESSFNPMARSYVPAYGLMQVVPRTAGKDATKHLFGKSQLLLPSYLYKKENNINVGSAYMHLLYYRYMRKIKDPQSRMYCAIAAYNTGPGNVAKVFAGVASMTKAAPIINKKTPTEIYNAMVKGLPYKETRKYLKKVVNTMSKYESI